MQAPAALQITAEQLVREAKERDLEIVAPPPKTKISDPEELAEYQRKRRFLSLDFLFLSIFIVVIMSSLPPPSDVLLSEGIARLLVIQQLIDK